MVAIFQMPKLQQTLQGVCMCVCVCTHACRRMWQNPKNKSPETNPNTMQIPCCSNAPPCSLLCSVIYNQHPNHSTSPTSAPSQMRQNPVPQTQKFTFFLLVPREKLGIRSFLSIAVMLYTRLGQAKCPKFPAPFGAVSSWFVFA